MQTLAKRRPIFHSEADWQLALAWESQLEPPSAQIRLEKRVANNPRIALDVLVRLDGKRYGLELKYPRSKLVATFDGEDFRLIAGAPDLDQHDVIKDLTRLERLVSDNIVDQGGVVVLTNARSVWSSAPRLTPTSFDAFRIHGGRFLTEGPGWGPNTGPGTKAGRAITLTVQGQYTGAWHDYSNVGTAQFRYTAICVPTNCSA